MSKFKPGDKVWTRSIPLAQTGDGEVLSELMPGVYEVAFPDGDRWYQGWEWNESDLMFPSEELDL